MSVYPYIVFDCIQLQEFLDQESWNREFAAMLMDNIDVSLKFYMGLQDV